MDTEVVKEIIRDTFLTTVLVRVGIVFLVILLVRILVSFYKYNIKLASFYESRRHSLSLSGIVELERIKTFAEVMSIEKIDFGNEVFDIKELLGSLKTFLDK
jgi:hypothetical protein